jgi:hypothetical protein
MIAENTDLLRGIVMSFLGCCIRWARSLASVVILLAVLPLVVSLAGQEPGANQSTSKVLQETFEFPPPVQWKMGGSAFGEMEISVVGLAWGPADSPQMISKGGEVHGQGAPRIYPDRPYALGICLRAVSPKPTQPQTIQMSGLVRIKNLDGSIEYPSVLTTAGFAGLFVFPGGVSDIPFLGSDTAEHWDFFPVSPDEKEFLFQVIPPMKSPILSFRVRVKDNKLAIEKVSPATEAPIQFTAHYGGTLGADSRLWFELSIIGSELSGFSPGGQYGKTLWFKGKVDSLGNFKLNEYYPENQLMGILDGKFSQDYRQMSGYFSKPDGSGLEPFELEETDPPGLGVAPGVPPCPTEYKPAGWKTYVNDKYRFCFSYPPNYTPIAEPWQEKYTHDQGDPEYANAIREAVEEGRSAQLQDTRHPDDALWVSVDTKGWDLESLMKYEPTGQDSPPEPKIIDGQVFYYYGPGGGGVCYPDQFFYDLRGRPLSISFTGPCVDDKTPAPETKEIEQKILATFRTF